MSVQPYKQSNLQVDDYADFDFLLAYLYCLV